jgi:predicted DNA-binding protein
MTYHMAFSLRLDPETEKMIRRYADATGRTKGAVVREALELFIAAEVQQAKFTRTTLDRLRPYVGSISSGGAQLSTDTHEKYRDALIRKARVRSSR